MPRCCENTPQTTQTLEGIPELTKTSLCETPTSTELHAPRSILLLIFILGGLSALGPLSIDMYLPAFPTMAEDLRTSASNIQKTLATYFVGLSIGQLLYGPIADRFGRKKPMYIGLLVYLLASVACAMAREVHLLMALRFLQALGGCAQMVIARAIVRDYFSPKESARFFASLMLVSGVAPIIAPILGGWLLVHFGWRAVFWTLVFMAIAAFIATRFFLDESLPPHRRSKHSIADTLRVYRSLLGDRAFMVYAFSGGLAQAGMFAYISGSPMVYMEYFDVQPEHFGFYFGLNAAGMIIAAQINRFLLKHINIHKLLTGALCVTCASGLTLLAMASSETGGFAGILIPLFIFLCSLGFVGPMTMALAMAPHGHIAGNASAALGSLQFIISGIGGMIVSIIPGKTALPMALGICLFTSTAFIIYLSLRKKEAVVW